jgi:hypothetical protein
MNFPRLAVWTVLSGLLAAPRTGSATDPVAGVVLRANGAGGTSAQQFLDKLVAVLGATNGWAGATARYITDRGAAQSYIQSAKPSYGIMSLPGFLALREAHDLKVVGQAEVSGDGGRQYHMVSVTETTLEGCKGKSLASDHGDRRFVESIVARGAFVLADFQIVEQKRPMQTLKTVARKEAVCALIDDAQLASLAKMEDGAAVHKAWSSKTLPPMVVVAFPTAAADEIARFRGNLAKICTGEGKTACAEAGIRKLASATDALYADVVRAY